MVKKIVLWAFVIGCMVWIFSFSAQNADDSMSLSDGLLNSLLNFLHIDLPEETVTFMRVFIRKVAHFSVYMLLGFWVYLLLGVGYTLKAKKACPGAVLWCMLYAASDEVHQLFVSGRSGMIKDVFIDTAGSLCGITLAWIVCIVINVLIKRRQKNG